jgi:Tfp pilus assembly protein PilO
MISEVDIRDMQALRAENEELKKKLKEAEDEIVFLQAHSDAWYAVVDTVNMYHQQWWKLGKTNGIDAMVEAIHKIARGEHNAGV